MNSTFVQARYGSLFGSRAFTNASASLSWGNGEAPSLHRGGSIIGYSRHLVIWESPDIWTPGQILEPGQFGRHPACLINPRTTAGEAESPVESGCEPRCAAIPYAEFLVTASRLRAGLDGLLRAHSGQPRGARSQCHDFPPLLRRLEGDACIRNQFRQFR